MHWTPITGLPEPLSAAAFKGSGARASKQAQLLEKQVTASSTLIHLPPHSVSPVSVIHTGDLSNGSLLTAI